MAATQNLPTVTREQLASFIKDPKTLTVFEAIVRLYSQSPEIQTQQLQAIAAAQATADFAAEEVDYLYFGGPWLYPLGLRADTVANLNVGYPPYHAGQIAYASNGRKNGEGAGAGTGVMCFRDASNWIACDSGTVLAA